MSNKKTLIYVAVFLELFYNIQDMILEGIIEEIIFRNDTNGYTVAMLSHGDEYSTVVGKFLSVNIGENVRLNGKFVTNSKYGEQFSFESSEVIMPSSVEGIKKYLSSGLIKGVGPITAEEIVKKFKENTFEIIEFSPQKLAEVKGISERKAKYIGDSFSELKKVQNTVMFLQSYNISTNMALKIYAIYQDKTINCVKENPYRMVEEIDGIGFLTADRIAQSMGIKMDSAFRIRAGFLHILNENSDKNGNTYIPKEMLLEQLSKLLNLDKDEYSGEFVAVLDNLILDKLVTTFYKHPYSVVMLTKYYFIETGVAQKLALLNISASSSSIDVCGDIEEFEKLNKIILDESQKNAIISSVQNGVSLITGGPGTGKTTIIKCIMTILKQQKNKIMLLAPTGRAAKRLSESTGEEAKTIHRGLEVDFRNEKGMFMHNETNPLDVNAVIVDEVSMVDVILMNALLKALPRDCKLILVGDKDQLPSVGAGNVLDDILKSNIISVNYLTKIFRQDANSLIISNAHLINDGEMPVIDNSSSDFFFDNKVELEDIKNTIVDMVTKRIPKFKNTDTTKIQVLAPLKAGVCGIENLNRSLQSVINPQSVMKVELNVGSTIFREGDKVMQMSNNYDLTWVKRDNYMSEEGAGVFNGDIGYIHKIDRQTGEVIVWFEDGRECVYPRTELHQLSLAYAITIHKSQGSEFDIVVIPIISGTGLILTRNLIYTGVTRAKKMVVLVGEKKNLKRMISNVYTVQRFTMLKDFLVTANDKVKELFC